MTTTEPAPVVTDHRLLHSSTETLMAEATTIRDRAHGTRITFSPKVFIPLTMLCHDKCGYCTFAQPPARVDSPTSSPTTCCASPARGPERLPRGVVHPRRAARGALRGRPRVAARTRLRLDGALRRRDGPARARRDRPAPPCQRRRPVRRRARAAPTRQPQPGDDDRVAEPRPRRPPQRTRQDAGTPARDTRGRRRTLDPVHHRNPRRHRREPQRSTRRRSKRSPTATAVTAMCKR